jgi:hypothetical protein
MRTFAYYVWKVEVAIRNLLGIKTECQYCKYYKWEKGCELFQDAEWWNNCVYFNRR